jgi:hypothetical protein
MNRRSSNQFGRIQFGVLENVIFAELERMPKSQRFVARAGDNRLPVRAHRQIKYTMTVAGKGRYHVEGRIFPNTDLVLRRGRRKAVR